MWVLIVSDISWQDVLYCNKPAYYTGWFDLLIMLQIINVFRTNRYEFLDIIIFFLSIIPWVLIISCLYVCKMTKEILILQYYKYVHKLNCFEAIFSLKSKEVKVWSLREIPLTPIEIKLWSLNMQKRLNTRTLTSLILNVVVL